MLNVAPNLKLPIDAVTQTFAVLAKRGVGKTYTASVIAEEMLAANQPIVAIDPTGAWWGLRSKYPVVILGGEHADVPLEHSAGEVVARAIVENRFPAVIDLSLFRKGQLIQFMMAFAETLYRLNRDALHLFVDEADAVAPQNLYQKGDEARMLGAMEDIVRRGRKRGIGCTLITQRPAVLNKNVLTQCENLFTLRLVHPKDIDSVKEWVNVHADPAIAKIMIESLPSLPIGTAWFWSPGWIGDFKRVAIRERETFDSGATPKPGEAAKKPKSLAKIDVAALGDQIKATVEKAKADDPKELKRKIEELKKLKAAPDEAAMQNAINAAINAALRPVVLEAIKIAKFTSSIADEIKKIDASLGIIEGFSSARPTASEMAGRSASSKLARMPATQKPLTPGPSPSRGEGRKSAPGGNAGGGDAAESLSKCERAILVALYWLRAETATPAKVSFYSDYSQASSSFANALGRLRTLGLVQGWTITRDGCHLIGASAGEKPAGSVLVSWLHGKLAKCERAILDVLIDAYPDRLTADQIGAAAQYSPGSSSFANALGKLRTIEAAEGYERDGGTKAADVFFE